MDYTPPITREDRSSSVDLRATSGGTGNGMIQGNFSLKSSYFSGERTSHANNSEISIRARETKYTIQEWIMIRSFTFSLILVLLVIVLFYFIYILLGDYVTVIFFALITGLALHPSKMSLLVGTRKFLGIYHETPKTRYYYQNALIVRVYKLLTKIPNVLKFKKHDGKSAQKEKTASIISILTTDLRYGAYICGIYGLYRKIGLDFCILAVVDVFVIDTVLRLILDLLKIASTRFQSFNRLKAFLKQSKEIDQFLETSIAAVLLVCFITFLVVLCIVLTMMLIADLNEIATNAKTPLSEAFNFLKPYVGNTTFHEEHLISFITTYNESISSFLEDTQLKTAYNVFSNLLANYHHNPLPACSYNQTSYFDSHGKPNCSNDTILTSFQNSSQPKVEILLEKCHQDFNLDLHFTVLNTLKYYYCYFVAYTSFFELNVMDIFQRLSTAGTFLAKLLFGTFLLEVVMVFKNIMEWFFKLTIFLYSLYYLLSSKETPLEKIMNIMPLEASRKKELSKSITDSTSGVFVCSIKIFAFHVMFTWITLDILNIKLAFITAILSGIFSIIPLLSSWMFLIPGSIYLYVFNSQPLQAIMLPVGFTIVSGMAFNEIYQKHIHVHPYVTGLSVLMGVYAFDLKGIIFGPLLVCIVLIMYETGSTSYIEYTKNMLKQDSYKTMIEQLDKLKNLQQESATKDSA